MPTAGRDDEGRYMYNSVFVTSGGCYSIDFDRLS